MNDAAVIQELRDAGALLEGHFILSSGLHSSRYVQCARALMDALPKDLQAIPAVKPGSRWLKAS